MELPEECYYTKEHEWIRVEDDSAVIGITDHAQSSLGDVVYVELPEKGQKLKKDDTFGSVESIKSVSDLYAPITGEVVELNDELQNDPSPVNQSPYEDGWMIKIKMEDSSELNDLMNANSYQQMVESES